MGIRIIQDNLTKKDIEIAKEDYNSYIKVTIDLDNKIVAIGGKYHADAQEELIKNHGSKKNIWGGGYNLETKQFETNAVINLQPSKNSSMEIIDPKTREAFLRLAKKVFAEIETLT